MDVKPTVLFSVDEFDGLHSAKHPLALRRGQAYDLKNNRKQVGGPISVRNGISTAVAAATGLAAGHATQPFQGATMYFDGAVEHWVLAWKESADNDIHLYHRTYTHSTTTWTNWAQKTADSGKFGDTALGPDVTNGRVAFWWADSPAQDQTTTGKDYHTFKDAPACVASDGAKTIIGDLQILVTGTELGDASKLFSHAKAIQRPDKGSVEFREYVAAEMSSAATPVGSGAGDWGTVNDTVSTWVFTTGAGSGTPAVLTGADTADISFDAAEVEFATYSSDQSFFLPTHFCMIAHASTGLDFWENTDFAFAWKPVNSGAYAFKYFDAPPLVLPTNSTNYELIVFKMPDLLPENADELEFNGLQMRTRVTTPVSCTTTIYSMFFGGVVPGGTEYGIARRNRSSHVHSPGVVCGDTTFGTKNSSTRGINEGVLDATERQEFNAVSSSTLRLKSRALPAGFILPIDSRVNYTPKIRFSEPHTGDLTDNGADYVCIYRKEPGDEDYYRVDRIPLGFYATGSWNYGSPASGTAASATYTYTDVVPTDYREFRDRLPDESCCPPPPFDAGAQIGPRSIVLEKSTYGTEVRLSEHGQPMRFSNSQAVSDDTKGGFNAKISGERGRAVAQSSYLGGNAESAQAIVFTDYGTWVPYRMNGDVVLYDLKQVNGHGSCTFSVAEGDGYVAYVDKDRDVRVIGLDGSLSRYKISDKLFAIPDAYVGTIDLAYWKGRIYIAYTPTGQVTNKQVLVYNFDGQYWEGYDTFPSGKEPQQFFHRRVAGSNLLYYIAIDGAIYEYEKSGQVTDGGTAITYVAESGEYHNDNFGPVIAQRMGVVADDASVTLTTTRTTAEPSGTTTASLDLSTGTDRAWKWDTTGSGAGIAGCESVGIRCKFEGDFSEAHSFYAMVAELSGGHFGGAS